jgi:hypothetical protein
MAIERDGPTSQNGCSIGIAVINQTRVDTPPRVNQCDYSSAEADAESGGQYLHLKVICV